MHIKKSTFSTSRAGSSFPANASNNVVFPELGGPKSNVILHITSHADMQSICMEKNLEKN